MVEAVFVRLAMRWEETKAQGLGPEDNDASARGMGARARMPVEGECAEKP